MGCLKLSYYEHGFLHEYRAGGMLLASADRNYSKEAIVKNKRGFNNKLNDDEVYGVEGSVQDYGMRINDTRLIRFFSVDPIAKSYPMLTPYQFASNTPIQAIDLDGQEAFFIHGTENDNSSWLKNNKKLLNKTFKNLTTNLHQDLSFDWSEYSDFDNNEIWDRNQAAHKLVHHIIAYREQKGIVDEDITLIGFSHGGNVAIQASRILWELYSVKVNIINFNVPTYQGLRTVTEDPISSKGINELYHFWTIGDGVAGYGAGAGTSRSTYKIPSKVKHVYEYTTINKGKNQASKHYLENINPKTVDKANRLQRVDKQFRNPELIQKTNTLNSIYKNLKSQFLKGWKFYKSSLKKSLKRRKTAHF